jgi:hypothetical protein
VKKTVLFVLILASLSSACFADEYVLVMSKDDCVCRHMLKIYNEDLRKYGEIKYDQHEEFEAIKWEKKRRFLRIEQEKKVYSPLEIDNIVLTSKFDINNDGKVETVIKDETVWYRGVPADSLYYFTGENSSYFKDEEFDSSTYKNATAKIGTGGVDFDGNVYFLKQLPKISIGIVGTKEAFSHYLIGGYFYINSFLYKGTYYIDMKDRQAWPDKWLVILKYTEENKPKDICYYSFAISV